MFKKSNKLNPPPNCPTIDEIIEDMGTFEMPHAIVAEQRLLQNTHNNEPIPTKEWWKSFETFLQDIEDFKVIQTNLLLLKDKLEISNTDIKDESNLIKSQINESLAKLKIDLNLYDIHE